MVDDLLGGAVPSLGPPANQKKIVGGCEASCNARWLIRVERTILLWPAQRWMVCIWNPSFASSRQAQVLPIWLHRPVHRHCRCMRVVRLSIVPAGINGRILLRNEASRLYTTRPAQWVTCSQTEYGGTSYAQKRSQF